MVTKVRGGKNPPTGFMKYFRMSIVPLKIIPTDGPKSHATKRLGRPEKPILALSAGELCVEHITKAVGGGQSAVSHQLNTLKLNKIVKSRREGKNILYSVDDDHIMAMIQAAKEHLHHE